MGSGEVRDARLNVPAAIGRKFRIGDVVQDHFPCHSGVAGLLSSKGGWKTPNEVEVLISTTINVAFSSHVCLPQGMPKVTLLSPLVKEISGF